MKKTAKILKAFTACIVFALALSAFVFCAACTANPPTEPKPSPSPTPPEAVKPEKPEEISLSKFISEVLAKTSSNFTLDLEADTDGEKTNAVFVRAENGICAEKENEKYVLSNGVLYTQTAVSDGEKAVWTAKQYSEEDFVLPNNTKELLDALFSAFDVDAKPEVTESGYFARVQINQADVLNDVFEIAVKNLDEPALVAVTELYNYFTQSSLSPSQIGAAIVLYGDSTLGELLDMGTPMTRIEFWAFYNTLRGYLGDSSFLPEYADFMAAYENKSLFGIIGGGSAEELVAAWETETLRMRLTRYPYTDGTLADFVGADSGTYAERADLTLELASDGEFVLRTLQVTAALQVKNVPVFSESLESGGLKKEDKDIDSIVTVNGTFSAVGESEVQVPSDFVFVGEQNIIVTESGSYGFVCGTENTRCENISARIDSDEITDNGKWVDTLTRIINGIEVNYEEKTFTVGADAYAAMLQAKQMGLTRLYLIVYNEFEFTVEVR